MNKFGLKSLAIGVVLAAGLATAASAAPAESPQHPKMTAAQMITPADFTPQEADYYKTLTDPAAQRSFIATRSYARLAWAVAYHKMPAIEFPDEPDAFDQTYIRPDEPEVIRRANASFLCSKNGTNCEVRLRGAPPEMTDAQMITPTQMTAQELAYYNTITDPEMKGEFIKTRSYVRLCKQVVDKTFPAELLPPIPVGYNPQFLLPDDPSTINVAQGMHYGGMMSACRQDKCETD